MEAEVVPGETGAYDVGTFDGAAGGYPVARGGSARRLEFSRIDEHESFAAAWKAQAQALAADPWGITALIQVQPRGGSVRQMRASLLTSRHDMVTQTGVIETIHRYHFRVGRNVL